ncbi:hypothetical protein [Geoalkalibacter sp.]|uniref:hypothetical protein n=1 Tax=Geoalkalibacter sp. TaxID=3041440 RepID=UPI00272E392D|nr:hypothetical protein [Geoalkalibacter sp.]
MWHQLVRLLPAALLCLLLTPTLGGAAEREHPWALLGYASIYTPDRLKDIFLNRHSYQDSYLGVLALSREFARTGASLGWEGEGQIGKYFGRQSHFEYNALVVARWHRFPWNHKVDTTFALGEGISWATRTPKLEARNHEKTSQLLNYLLFELTLAPPHSRLYLSGRIHHRSGVFGLYNGVRGGSNFLGMGLGYRF